MFFTYFVVYVGVQYEEENKQLVHFNIHNLHWAEIFLDSRGDKGNYVELSSLFFETFFRQHYHPFS